MRIEHWLMRLHSYDYNNFVERTENKNSSNKRKSTLCLHGQASVRSLQHNSCVVSRIKVWILTKTRWNERCCLNEQLGASDNREDSHRTRRRNKLRISTTGTLLMYKFCNFYTVWQYCCTVFLVHDINSLCHPTTMCLYFAPVTQV